MQGISRRTALAGALGTALATHVRGIAQAPGDRPNFLFIMADDMGYADLSCYGRREYQTPVLDTLASQESASRMPTRTARCVLQRAWP